LADVHTFEFVVVKQMIAAVFELVDSIEFNIAEETHPTFIRTDSDQLLEVEQCACYPELSFCFDVDHLRRRFSLAHCVG